MTVQEGSENQQGLVLPSTRLIELETLLRQRDQENERLGVRLLIYLDLET